MLLFGDDFFDPHAGNVNGSQMHSHVGVTFLGSDHKTSRLSDSKIHSSERSISVGHSCGLTE
jgi:hypothetical protein